MDAVRFQTGLQHGARVGFLALHQAWCAVDDRDVASEPARALAELEADVAAADHDRARGRRRSFEPREVRQIRHVRDAVDRGDERARARVDDDAGRANRAAAAGNDSFTGKRSARAHEVDPGLRDARFATVVPFVANAPHALHHGHAVDTDVGMDAEGRRVSRASGVVRRREERFRWRAAEVDARAADARALEEHDVLPRFRVIDRERYAALAAPDHDQIDVLCFLRCHPGRSTTRR